MPTSEHTPCEPGTCWAERLRQENAALKAELADERADRKAYYKHYIEAHADANALRGEYGNAR